jgi:hypothetical protein
MKQNDAPPVYPRTNTRVESIHTRPEIVAALAAISEVWHDCSILVITPDRSAEHADLIQDLKAAGVSGRWRVER